MWRQKAVVGTLAHLFLVYLVNTRAIDIAMQIDVTHTTINQTCVVNPIGHLTQLKTNISEYFDRLSADGSYPLGRFTIHYCSGKWSTVFQTQMAIQGLHHAILFSGSDEHLKIVGTLANSQSVPVVSLFPRHSWYRDGSKLPNVVIPRTGQSLKGRAALDLVKPPHGSSIKIVAAVVEEDGFSPEMQLLLKEKRNTPGVFVINFPLSMNSLELAERDLDVSIDASAEIKLDSIVVDCNLGELLHKIIVGRIKHGVIHSNTIVIFLHELHEVQKWGGLSELVSATSYIFAFQQRVPTSFDQGVSFHEALARDALQVVARAANASNFSYKLMDWEPVYLANMTLHTFDMIHLTGGYHLVEAMKRLCFRGHSGKFSFTSGEALQDSCLNEDLVEFDILRINRTNILNSDSNCENDWFRDGIWAGNKGLQRSSADELWEPSVNKQEKANLSVLLVPFGPFVYRSKEGIQAGVDWDLLKFIMDHGSVVLSMAQVRVTIWNGTREEALKEMEHANVNYDLLIGAIIISKEASDRIKYTRSYFTLRMRVIVLKGGKDSNVMWRFMKPFGWDVWLAAFTVLVCGGFVSKWLGLTHSYRDGLWLTTCTIFFLQENRLVQMRNPFGRIFILSLSLFFLILVSSYTANMVSFLSPTEQSKPTFDPMSSVLVTVHKEPYIWLQSTGYNITTVASVEEAIGRVRQGKAFGFIADLPLVRQTVLKAGPGCDLTIFDANFLFPKRQYAIAVSTKLDPLLVNQINQVIVDAISHGFVENSYVQHMRHNVSSPCWQEAAVEDSILPESADGSEESLGINSFTGVAVVVACASILCLVLKALMTFRYKHRKTETIA